MNLKKKLITLLTVVMMIFIASPFALAVPDSEGNDAQEQQQVQTQTQQQAAVPAAAGTTEYTNSKYLTKGGAAFWFVFIVLVNSAVSFWVGNRFYRLSKKDNHISAEIRALRRDVEDKFTKSVGGFAEQEIDIENLNESLAMDDEGIIPSDSQPLFREVSAEEEERFRRWEESQQKHTAERTRPRSAVREELDEELQDVRKIRKKNYQPKRDSARDEYEDDEPEEDLGKTRAVRLRDNSARQRDNAVASKAKEILNDMFPFKED